MLNDRQTATDRAGSGSGRATAGGNKANSQFASLRPGSQRPLPPPLPAAHAAAPASQTESTPDMAPTAAQQPQGRSRRGGLAWGLAGFLAGVVFWHFVGFWDFVEGVVLNTNRDSAKTAAKSPRTASPAPTDVVTGSIGPQAAVATPRRPVTAAERCAALRSGREIGGILPADCAPFLASPPAGLRLFITPARPSASTDGDQASWTPVSEPRQAADWAATVQPDDAGQILTD